MTLLGKILTVLIFVMSVFFMGLAVATYASRENWRVAAEDLKGQLDEALETNKQRLAELDRLKSQLAEEQAARRHALANLSTKLEQAQEQLEQQEVQLAERTAELGRISATLQTNQNILAKATEEVEALRDQVRQAQLARDKQFTQLVAVTDQYNQLQGVRRRLQERQDQLVDQVARMRNVMDRVGLAVDAPVDETPPRVDGLVVAVGEGNLIEISIGADDGVREGHQLDVFRENAYLGRVVVRRTTPNRAVAEILPEFRKGLIRKGDRVATRLS